MTIVLTPASAIEMQPVRWLWTDRIPTGEIALVPGREGIGKSLFLVWLTARVTTGNLPGRYHGTARPVVYAASEDSWAHTIAPRLYAAGADLDLVYRVEVATDDGTATQLTLPRDCDGLAAEITRRGIAMVAADPLMSFIAAGIDTHRDRDLRTVLEPLKQMADTTGCAVVGLAHFNKSTGVDALNLITGSRAFSSIPRAVLAMARDPEADDGSCVLSQVKNSFGPLDLPSLRYVVQSAPVPTTDGPTEVGTLRFLGETDRSVEDILASTGEHTTRSERDSVATWLHDMLTAAGGQAFWDEIRKAAKEAGQSERTVHRARQRLGVVIERTGFPARSLWRLPEPAPDEGHAASTSPPVAPQSRQSCHVPRAGTTGTTGATAHSQSHLYVVTQPTGDAS